MISHSMSARNDCSKVLHGEKNHLRTSRFRITLKEYCKFLLVCALVSFHSSVAFADNQENLKTLRERIQSLQKELTAKEALKQSASTALQETERAIHAMKTKLVKLTESNRQAHEELKQLQAQHRKIRHTIEIEQHQLEKLLYHQYLEGQQPYLKLVLRQQDPHQLTRNLYYYQKLSEARSESIVTLLNNQTSIETLVHARNQKKQHIAAIQNEYTAQQLLLEQEKHKQRILLSQISEQISQQQQEINTLKNDEKRLTNLVNEINKLLVQEKTKGNNVNTKLPDASTSGVPFTSLKGKLNLPVRGKLLNTFGGQRSGKHVTWKGLFIQSPSGNEVKAISEGRVVFADWLRGFGNLIILDHGNGYMSLYGNNETLHKQVGNIIRGGDTIASVGNSSDNSETGLYFELRHKGKPFDPLTWIKIE